MLICIDFERDLELFFSPDRFDVERRRERERRLDLERPPRFSELFREGLREDERFFEERLSDACEAFPGDLLFDLDRAFSAAFGESARLDSALPSSSSLSSLFSLASSLPWLFLSAVPC